MFIHAESAQPTVPNRSLFYQDSHSPGLHQQFFWKEMRLERMGMWGSLSLVGRHAPPPHILMLDL